MDINNKTGQWKKAQVDTMLQILQKMKQWKINAQLSYFKEKVLSGKIRIWKKQDFLDVQTEKKNCYRIDTAVGKDT